jgi:glycosyl transferase family 25
MSVTIGGITVGDVLVISLKENHDKRKSVLEECKKLGIVPKFYLANKHPTSGVQGCLESHMYCINYAKRNNLENVLILEEDIVFEDNVLERLASTVLPNEYDMFYLGYHILNGYRENTNTLKILSGLTTHSYIIHHSIYDYVLENIKGNWQSIPEYHQQTPMEVPFFKNNLRAIDIFYAKWVHHRRNKTYGVYPLVATQRPGFSDIENATVDYTNLFKSKSILFSEQKLGKYIGCFKEQNKMDLIKELKQGGFNSSDYILITPTGTTDDLKYTPQPTQIVGTNTWDVLHVSLSSYLLRLSYSTNTICTNEEWVFPSMVPGEFPDAYHEKTQCSKKILCVYGKISANTKDICDVFGLNINDYYIYFCSGSSSKKGANNSISLEQYKALPNHTLLLIDDMNYFIDQPIRGATKIVVYMTSPRFIEKWNDITVPFSGKSIFYNMRKNIDSVICKNEQVYREFIELYQLSPGNSIYAFKKFNKQSGSIVCDYNDPKCTMYLSWYKQLLTIIPNLKLYIYNSPKQAFNKSVFYMSGPIEYQQYELYFGNEPTRDVLKHGIIAVGSGELCAIQSTQPDFIKTLGSFLTNPIKKQILIENVYQTYNNILIYSKDRNTL